MQRRTPTAFYYDILYLQCNDAKCMYFNNISWLNNSHIWSKALRRLAHNPIFDHNLIRDLAYAWSLPTHPTFEQKIELIKAAIDDAITSPLPLQVHAPVSQVLYFMHKIREVVRVSDAFLNADVH